MEPKKKKFNRSVFKQSAQYRAINADIQAKLNESEVDKEIRAKFKGVYLETCKFMKQKRLEQEKNKNKLCFPEA